MKNSLGVHRICVNPHQPKISYHTPISVVLPSSLRTCLRVSTLFMSAKDSLMLLESKYNRAAKRTSNTKKHTHSLTQTHKHTHYTQQPQNKEKPKKKKYVRNVKAKRKTKAYLELSKLYCNRYPFHFNCLLFSPLFSCSPLPRWAYTYYARERSRYIYIYYIYGKWLLM